jgi:hypothetical protein
MMTLYVRYVKFVWVVKGIYRILISDIILSPFVMDLIDHIFSSFVDFVV